MRIQVEKVSEYSEGNQPYPSSVMLGYGTTAENERVSFVGDPQAMLALRFALTQVRRDGSGDTRVYATIEPWQIIAVMEGGRA